MSQAKLDVLRSQFDEGDEVIVSLPPTNGGSKPVSIPGVVLEVNRASLVVAEAGSPRTRRVKLDRVQLVRRVQDITAKPEEAPMAAAPIARLVLENQSSKPLTARPFETLLARSPLAATAAAANEVPQPTAAPNPPPTAAANEAVPTKSVAANDFVTWLEMGRGLQQSAKERIAQLKEEAAVLQVQAADKLQEAARLNVALDDLIRISDPAPRTHTAATRKSQPKPRAATIKPPQRLRVSVASQTKVDQKPTPKPKPSPQRRRHIRGPHNQSFAAFVRKHPKMPSDQLCELAKGSGFPHVTRKQISVSRSKDRAKGLL